jgi:hypothetical protein
MKHLKHIIFFLVVSTFAFAQNSTRIFKKASIKDNGVLEVEVNDGIYSIQFYTPEIVETTFVPSKETKNNNKINESTSKKTGKQNV